jgi:hypothetical protein
VVVEKCCHILPWRGNFTSTLVVRGICQGLIQNYTPASNESLGRSFFLLSILDQNLCATIWIILKHIPTQHVKMSLLHDKMTINDDSARCPVQDFPIEVWVKTLFPHWDYSHVRHRRSFRLVINRSFLFSTCGSFESPVSGLTNHSYHGLARLDEPASYPGPVDEGNFHINFLLGCIKWVYHMSFLQQCR